LPQLRVLVVVGSVGKTTTKELLAAALTDLHPHATPAHVNTELGVCQWFLNISASWQPTDTHVLIVEVGAYGPGEVDLVCQLLAPEIAIVTALGGDHLGLFKTEDAIVAANAEALRHLPSHGLALLYADNDASRAQGSTCPVRSILCGRTGDAEFLAHDVRETPQGLAFGWRTLHVDLSVHGLHNAGNALLALAAAEHLGIAPSRAAMLLSSARTLAHTFTVEQRQGITILDDTYNISLLSVRAALQWAADRPERPRALLCADMLELGEHERELVEALGREANGCLERVILLHPTDRAAFAKGFTGQVESLHRRTPRLAPGSLLLCLGRLPADSIASLLPR
jgi:UDP-N-acetylmuramoyl-tripeptide--D-alanyl-D-alanine ligase